jgi:hypothetical protein
MTGGIALWVIAIIAALGWLVAIRVYVELKRWARQCQKARIAIFYKRKATLNAPIVEWLNWCNSLDKDEQTKGRVVYRGSHVSVAILKPSTMPEAEVKTS